MEDQIIFLKDSYGRLEAKLEAVYAYTSCLKHGIYCLPESCPITKERSETALSTRAYMTAFDEPDNKAQILQRPTRTHNDHSPQTEISHAY